MEGSLEMSKRSIMVSACLLGINCKYNGGNNYNGELLETLKDYNVIPFCPEQLGGLPTPRPKSEIRYDKVINEFGNDVTDKFVKGARESLKILDLVKPDFVIFMDRSPSCGKGKIYDGTFSSLLIDGNGITVKYFIDRGIEVYSISEWLAEYSG